MSSLSQDTKHIVNKFHLWLNKDLGQHFLIDPQALSGIVNSAELTKDDLVIEIGTGIGTLTKPLAQKAGFVITVEKDKKMIEPAKEYLKGLDNIEIMNEDFIKLHLEKVIAAHPGSRNIKVVANLPYYITSPILSILLEGKTKFDLIIVTIQKEVAERIVSKPGIKAYGSFSIFVNYFTKPSILFDVPKRSFFPVPEVGSAVLKLEVLKEPSVKVKDEKMFFRIVHAAFVQRRKMLKNAIENANINGIDEEKIVKALDALGIDRKRRGETLSIGDFAKLADELSV